MAGPTEQARVDFSQREAELAMLTAEDTSPLSVDALLDALCAIYEECQRLENKSRLPAVQAFVNRYAPMVSKLSTLRLSMSDFKVVKTLGRGAFGEVNLCACQFDGQYYAIKKIRKSKMLQSQEAFYMEERELLALARGHWITTLEYAFQDDEYLYLVMEYLAGGNLLNLLYKQTLDPSAVRFYAAEAVLGVREVHNLGFAYRDLKPDNMLLDRTGHLKLADFGSCVHLDEHHKVHSYVPVGTPYYIAPEVLRAQEAHEPCGHESDWWSLGVVLYEMFVGDPPFYSESLVETYKMIMEYKKYLKFPADADMPAEAVDLIRRLICDRTERLSVEGIMSHPFFAGVDWEGLRTQTPPFVPELLGPDDTSHFDDDFDQPEASHDSKPKKLSSFTGEPLSFIGYTFRRNGRSGLTGSKSMATLPSRLSGLDAPGSPMEALRRGGDGSLDAKKAQGDADRWLAKYRQEKQRAETAEALRDSLAADLERKERALTSETAARTKADEQIGVLEKAKTVVELELAEVQRRLATGQRERQAAEDRVSELETGLAAAERKRDDLLKSLSGQAADQMSHDEELRQHRKRLDDQALQLAALEDQLAEAVARRGALEKELASVTASLAEERQQRDGADAQIRDLRKALSDAMTKETRLLGAAEKRDKDMEALQNEVTQLTAASEAEAATRATLQKSKVELETRKTMLELQVSQLHDQLAHEADRQASLSEKITQLESALATQPEAQNSAGHLERTNSQITEALAKERLARERSDAKMAELSNEKAKLVADLAAVNSQADAAKQENEALTVKLGRMQKILEKKIDDELDLEEKGEALSKEIVALKAELEALQRALDHQLRTAGRLEVLRKETEAERDGAEAKLVSMKKKLDAEADERQKLLLEVEDYKTKWLKDKQGLLSLQGELDAVTTSKEASVRDLEKVRKRLEEVQTEHDRQEQDLAALRRDKAVLELEVAQLEKRSHTEAERTKGIETRLAEVGEQALANATLAAKVTETNDRVTQEKEALEEQLRNAKAELAALHETANAVSYRNDQLLREKELAATSFREALQNMERNAPKSAQQERKEYRKLREMYTTLQRNQKTTEGRLAEEEGKRKKLEAQLADEETVTSNAGEHAESQGIGSLLRRATTLRVTRLLPNAAKTSTEFHITNTGFEGYLKVAKEKGIRHGWNKRYIVVRDSRVYQFEKEKEKDKDKLSDDALIADLKIHVVIFRDPPLDVQTVVTPAEAACTFVMYVLRTPPNTSDAAVAEPAAQITPAGEAATATARATKTSPPPSSSSSEMSLATIQATLKTKEKDLAIEERLLSGATGLLSASKGADQKKSAQRQVDGAQARVDQLKREVARLKEMEAAASTLAASAPAAGGKASSERAQAAVQLKISTLREMIKVESGSLQTFSMVNTNLPKEIVTDFQENVRHKVSLLQSELDKWTACAADAALTEEKVAAVEADVAAQYREFAGHKYLPRKFSTPMRCQICVQMLHQTSQSLECTVCKYVVHKECYTTGGHTCKDVVAAQSTKPHIFMAADESDRERWLSNLATLRDSLSPGYDGSRSTSSGSGLPSPVARVAPA